jgi:hypothetical protein
MSSLGAKEIYKRPGRVDTFITKMQNGNPFELVSGSSVVLKNDPKVAAALRSMQDVSKITLVSKTTGAIVKFSQLKKSKEFGGGTGSGAGADATALNESAQAVFAAARWINKRVNKLPGDMVYYDDSTFLAGLKNSDVTNTLEEIKSLDDSWIKSSVAGASKLYSMYGSKKYTFHRQSSWVKNLERHWKTLNAAADNPFSDINKWSPADIYLISDNGARAPINSTKNLVELNNLLLENFNSKDIVGVSLKKITSTARATAYNIGEKKKTIKYVDYTVGKVNFFQAKDVYIYFTVDGAIQFRTFPSFQGEIKGEAAAQGKIGYGSVAKVLRDITQQSAPEINAIKQKIRSKDNNFLDSFFSLYQGLSKDPVKLSKANFVTKLQEKDEEWQLSKYLGCVIIDTIKRKKVEDRFVSEVISYASSTSKLSGPFLKLE